MTVWIQGEVVVNLLFGALNNTDHYHQKLCTIHDARFAVLTCIARMEGEEVPQTGYQIRVKEAQRQLDLVLYTLAPTQGGNKHVNRGDLSSRNLAETPISINN